MSNTGKKLPYVARESGRFNAKNKGRLNELMCVKELKNLGWNAMRVPLSGAAVGFKGDVWAEHEKYGKFVIEVKARNKVFDSIYHYYEEYRNLNLRYLSIYYEGYHVTITHEFNEFFQLDPSRPDPTAVHGGETHILKLRRIMRFMKWLKECDLLAIRGNSRPFLFLRYYKTVSESDPSAIINSEI